MLSCNEIQTTHLQTSVYTNHFLCLDVMNSLLQFVQIFSKHPVSSTKNLWRTFVHFSITPTT